MRCSTKLVRTTACTHVRPFRKQIHVLSFYFLLFFSHVCVFFPNASDVIIGIGSPQGCALGPLLSSLSLFFFLF